MNNPINWDRIDHFISWEFDDPDHPGSGKNIDGSLLLKLHYTRREANCPMIIHRSAGGAVDMEGTHGHADKSFHRYDMGCKAVDFHFKNCRMSFREQYGLLTTMGFGGIGWYPEWNNPGWHVDVRPILLLQRWNYKNGVYSYLL